MRVCVSLLLMLCLVAVAAAPDGDLKAAEKAIRAGLMAGSPKQVEQGVREAVKVNNADAVKMLLKYAANRVGDEYSWMEQYWLLLNGIAGMGTEEAQMETANYILKNKGKAISRDLMTALSSRGQRAIIPAMNLILEKGDDDLKILAADHLSTIGDRSSIQPLIDAMKKAAKKNDTLLRKCGYALQAITGQLYGDSLTNWEGWWEANKNNPDLKLPERSWGGKRNTGTVADTLTGSREGEYERLLKGKVLVIQAGKKYHCGHSHDFDKIDEMARRLRLKVDVIDKGDLENPEKNKVPNFDDYVAILCNCTHIRSHCDKLKCPDCKGGSSSMGNRLVKCECPKNVHPTSAYVMPQKGIDMIKRYVEKGGYLFAEDWCMEDFVEKIWGDRVKHGTTRPADETVKVVPKAGMSSHPYLRNIFFKPPKESRDTMTEGDLEKIDHEWKIDKETRCIDIQDPKRVTVLLVSPDLEKYASGQDAVAITFAVGGKDGKRPAVSTGGKIEQDRGKMSGGRVMYVLSHFGKQKSKKDEYTLQNLMLNFLIEASERRAHYEKRRKK